MNVTGKVATYIGRRMTTKNRLAYFWLFDGVEKGYKKQVAPAQIGEVWTIYFNDKGAYFIAGEHKPQLHSTARAGEEFRAKWAIEEVVAEQSFTDYKTKKILAGRETELEQALKPLRRFFDAALKAHGNRQALIAYITSELWEL